jgi:hypothetical protein
MFTAVEDSESQERSAEKEEEEDEDDSNLYFSADTIKNVLKHLAQGFKVEVVSLFFKTKDRVQKILLHLNQRLATAHRRQVPRANRFSQFLSLLTHFSSYFAASAARRIN